MNLRCENCGAEVKQPKRGRPRRFCSIKCSRRKGFADREASRKDVTGIYDSSWATHEARSYNSGSSTYQLKDGL